MLDDQGDPPRLLKILFQPALEELKARHPDIDIKLDYRPIPYLNLHEQFLTAMSNQTSVDIMTIDRIWLGEFVEKDNLPILQTILQNGEDKMTSIKRTGMVVYTKTKYMGFGQLLM